MHTTVHTSDGSTEIANEAALLAGLTSKSDIDRCFSRGVASGLTQPVVSWCEAEIERGTDGATIIIALIKMVTQQVASLTGNVMDPTGFPVVASVFVDLIGTTFIPHATRVAAVQASAKE